MEDPNKDQFEERLAALAEKASPNKKVVRKVQEDGLIIDVVEPVRQRQLMPFRSLLLALFLFVAMKGTVYAQLGQAEYLSRVDTLKSGNSLEVTAAFLLDVDPATQAIGDFLGRFLN